MNCTDCTGRLHDYVDGELAATDLREVETHLSECASCRAELNALRTLLERTHALPHEIAPPPELWSRIEAKLGEAGTETAKEAADAPANHHARSTAGSSVSVLLQWFVPLGVAASIAFIATFAERRLVAWNVSAVTGAPRVDTEAVLQGAKFRVGQWLETDAESRAQVTVGSIGQVNLEPNSRLRLVGVAANDHRLELARGTMSAFIYAPPRLFFVNTPSATAVDLGCAYTLKVDDEGNGELEVSTGYVALEDGDREAIIRSGMMCLTRRGFGPGTPFAVDAPPALRSALARFDFERGATAAALPDVLTHARSEDTITLWHLLARTRGEQRVAVYDALAQRSAPPAGVTRDGILKGDAAMRKAWGSDLGIDRF